jgi:hypothetical protein
VRYASRGKGPSTVARLGVSGWECLSVRCGSWCRSEWTSGSTFGYDCLLAADLPGNAATSVETTSARTRKVDDDGEGCARTTGQSASLRVMRK